MAARNRLLIELREAQRMNDSQVRLIPNHDNLYEWVAVIVGPKESPYQNGKWKLRLICPPTYPLSPPTVTFLTKCFHPNVDFRTGAVCLNILRDGSWTPAWNLHYVCLAICALMDIPNADSPLNCDAGNLIRSGDLRGFRSMARMYTIEYASAEITLE
ncbi:ubiquitin conjugating enzyme E2, putative [Toxoplasma gondii ME49]|uniref:Ubiquitin conjugating enzyme E2, putative n=4 Tax=Toxoplasma gondii TaxID=5811 RepID=A0A125YRY3_TOXGM|nr:ubiquitin conjugating enzyme E2, putative [Toxoplasma gondii ME49]EPR61286.1 putative ubiquitin conjugating enzyme E2 [Toxoplasma gondii GT1]EPT29859.1 ubiquitin conjugating enzyme E2, putative [Toxoplasma gondii ME49]KFG36286.1 putative ubiquitin conjugating enzyme E2 [Toxoplasma gondii FOU]|eukprot:XP_002371438.1 ubiquitin conjugating enzyme E2, putative [Toxoplasma gondii ME49]